MTRQQAIRAASFSELLPVLRASAQAQEERGLPMWPQEALTAERLQRQYPGGQGYVGTQGGPAVAAMILVATDPHFWPHDPHGEALYLHKLAVHPDWQGAGLGSLMVEAAAEQARAAGVLWLRLDTAADRPKLRAIYEALGFMLVREGRMDGWPAAWYGLNLAATPTTDVWPVTD